MSNILDRIIIAFYSIVSPSVHLFYQGIIREPLNFSEVGRTPFRLQLYKTRAACLYARDAGAIFRRSGHFRTYILRTAHFAGVIIRI